MDHSKPARCELHNPPSRPETWFWCVVKNNKRFFYSNSEFYGAHWTELVSLPQSGENVTNFQVMFFPSLMSFKKGEFLKTVLLNNCQIPVIPRRGGAGEWQEQNCTYKRASSPPRVTSALKTHHSRTPASPPASTKNHRSSEQRQGHLFIFLDLFPISTSRGLQLRPLRIQASHLFGPDTPESLEMDKSRV